jgi:hypothetical protein
VNETRIYISNKEIDEIFAKYKYSKGWWLINILFILGLLLIFTSLPIGLMIYLYVFEFDLMPELPILFMIIGVILIIISYLYEKTKMPEYHEAKMKYYSGELD